MGLSTLASSNLFLSSQNKRAHETYLASLKPEGEEQVRHQTMS
jgi:hypothetical protein